MWAALVVVTAWVPVMATTTNWQDPTSILLTAGPGGIVLALVLMKRLAPYWVVEDKDRQIEVLQKENSALADELRENHKVIEDRVIPALVRATDAVGRGPL